MAAGVMGPQRRALSAGRWQYRHGPIDVMIGADGDAHAVAAAHAASWQRMQSVLAELVAELTLLRQPVRAGACPLQGVVARRMWQACAPFADRFITPMAAVAGAVAEALIEPYRADGIRRAWVNNGGDIALHLAPGASVRVGLMADIAQHRLGANVVLDGRFEVHAHDAVRGIATSGWRGRSFSLGIADSVTVLARTAAEADAAATMIANAVDLDDARIVRRPACELKDDSDLGERLVTVEVPALPPAAVRRALQAGVERARELHGLGLIAAAALTCQSQTEVVTEAALGATIAALQAA